MRVEVADPERDSGQVKVTEGETLTVGSAAGNDVQIADPTVSSPCARADMAVRAPTQAT